MGVEFRDTSIILAWWRENQHTKVMHADCTSAIDRKWHLTFSFDPPAARCVFEPNLAEDCARRPCSFAI